MKYLLIFACLYIQGLVCYSQIGGRYAYEFLNLTSSPKVGALGGKLISHPGNDLSLVYYNPALLTKEMRNQVSINFVSYFADVKYGYLSYSHSFKKKFNVAYGLQYINYGSFTQADENGYTSGTFTCADYALNIAASMPLDSFFTVGADIRPIISQYESYHSTGLSSDFGITYFNPAKLIHLALVVRNLGTELQSYAGTMEPLPFEIQLGYTQYLKYAPFNISITAHHLETWDMSVLDHSDESSSINSDQNKSKRGLDKFSDQLMRHFIFGVEFTPFRNFYLRLGYNYQRRKELKITTTPGTAGISWGFGFSISRFQFSYGRATYHLAGASNLFSISTNLKSFYKKDKR
jgi:hypothetical protein